MNATGLDVQIDDISEATAGLALQGRLSRHVLEGRPAGTGSTSATSGADRRPSKVRRRRHAERLHRRPGLRARIPWRERSPFGTASSRGPTTASGRQGSKRWTSAASRPADPDRSGVHERPACIRSELKYSPFEIGLGRLVKFDKAAEFTGKRALLAERDAGGPERRLVGLELDWSAIEAMYARHDLAPQISPQVQRARSRSTRTVCRSVARPPWMGAHDQEDGRLRLGGQRTHEDRYAPLGRVVGRGERGKVGATVVPMPFLDLDRKRA